jgi:hypothetical protein
MSSYSSQLFARIAIGSFVARRQGLVGAQGLNDMEAQPLQNTMLCRLALLFQGNRSQQSARAGLLAFFE